MCREIILPDINAIAYFSNTMETQHRAISVKYALVQTYVVGWGVIRESPLALAGKQKEPLGSL